MSVRSVSTITKYDRAAVIAARVAALRAVAPPMTDAQREVVVRILTSARRTAHGHQPQATAQ